METIEIIKTKKQIIASEASLEDSTFKMVCISRAVLNDVAAIDVKITDANLTNLEIEGAQLGGAYLHNIGMPPVGHPYYKEGQKQKPLTFENCDLNSSTFTDCNLDGVSIADCNLANMTINGIPVDDLLKAYALNR